MRDYLEYPVVAVDWVAIVSFFLRASTQAQHAGRNGHDHDHFD